MKIDNSINNAATALPGESPARPARAAQKAAAVSVAHGQPGGVQLSPQLQTIEKNFASSEVFDIARVNEIKQAISEGRFTVNPGKIADGLLDSVRDLIQNRNA
jgi:negative regulator of flagellin synthesis FlgM